MSGVLRWLDYLRSNIPGILRKQTMTAYIDSMPKRIKHFIEKGNYEILIRNILRVYVIFLYFTVKVCV